MIISDSTPLIHLARIGRLDLLSRLFKKVIIPESVFNEIVIKGEEQGYLDAKLIRKATEEWIEIKELNKEELTELDEILKIGPIGIAEGEAITLANNMRLPLLIDDSIGQKIARTLNIETYWTTSVVLKGVSVKIITRPEAKKLVEDLINGGLRVKPEVVIELMKILS